MFADFVYEKSAAAYEKRILLIDADDLESKTGYSEAFRQHGFEIIRYENDLRFRIDHDDAMYGDTDRLAIIAGSNTYIPYDVRRRFRAFEVSVSNLFSRLDASVIKEDKTINYDMLSIAYKKNYEDLSTPDKTLCFRENITSYSTVSEYLKERFELLQLLAGTATTYKDWFQIANIKSEIDLLAARHSMNIDTGSTESKFVDFVLSGFGKLSAVIDKDSPVLVSKAMDFMHDRSDKFAVIVMDGMSEFDWHIIAQSFGPMKYQKTDMFAMIPTTTSISRQCLLSGKYPSQLTEPWKQSQEKNEFIACAHKLGYTDMQIGYERGYDAEFSAYVKCAAVIINDVDDMVHGQKQGRLGMKNDIGVLAKQGKLAGLARRLLRHGFDVYITADHGNTPCTGTGKLMKTGVETETKSRRMIVLKDFADKSAILAQRDMIDYPKYYLDKKYDYLICKSGQSFDAKGEGVMSHGGITLDEAVVPFIMIKGGENNG